MLQINDMMTESPQGRKIAASLEVEHDRLHELLRPFKDSTATDATLTRELLDQIAEFCKSHFAYEEAELRKAGEMALDRHAPTHPLLLQRLDLLYAGI
jgi:hemerythrin